MNKSFAPQTIAVFITPHGYGHAARAAAVMLAMQRLQPGTIFEIFTRVPAWFFQSTLQGGFHYHDLATDVGLAQDSVMEENLPETVDRLGDMLPFDPSLIAQLAQSVRELGCAAVLCDVAAMGIAVAQAAGIPCILEENFTWDWIYEGYRSQEPRLQPYIEQLQSWYAAADFHVRTEPACSYDPPAYLTTGVVGRTARTDPRLIRRQLGIAPEEKVILVTMGGIGSEYPFLKRLQDTPKMLFLIPGAGDSIERHGSLITLPSHSEFYHPDLVEAADVVVGKLGYSTLAEAYLSGIPYAYIPRPRFRESDVMSGFVDTHMHGVAIDEARFFAGDWLDELPRLLAIPRRKPAEPNGADAIARLVIQAAHKN